MRTTIQRLNFDSKVTYVGRRVATAAIRTKALGLTVPALPQMQTGYLLVQGDKPGLLLYQVKWDGKDVYQRDGLVGSISALNSTNHKGFKAEVLTQAQLLQRALDYNRIVRVRKVEDDSLHTLALLNSFSELYVAGVKPTKTGYVCMNLETPAPHNTEKVQFTDFVDVIQPIRAFLRV